MTRTNSNDFSRIFLEDVPLLDVRAPVEFNRGAFQHAINLPLMNDRERHLVGIRYKEAGQDAAIELGRKLINAEIQSSRTQAWLDFARAHPEGYLYCFRGGLRSRISQQWMAESGIDYPYVMGGYKAMRRFLIDRFSADITTTPLILISGRTGTGKTHLLHRIQRSLDLEGLARHRGSSFGLMENSQPSPINFENQLSIAMQKLAASKPGDTVFVEGEGRCVGRRALPDVLWNKMQDAPTLVLEAEIERRIDIGVQDYVIDLLARIQKASPGEQGFKQFAERHRDSLTRISRRFGSERYALAAGMLEDALNAHQQHNDTACYRPFIAYLLKYYYDPMYDYQLSQRKAVELVRGDEAVLIDWLKKQGVETHQ